MKAGHFVKIGYAEVGSEDLATISQQLPHQSLVHPDTFIAVKAPFEAYHFAGYHKSSGALPHHIVRVSVPRQFTVEEHPQVLSRRGEGHHLPLNFHC